MTVPHRSQHAPHQGWQHTRAGVVRYQQQHLRALLAYVWEHSAFYRDYYYSHGIRAGDLTDLTIGDLPFTTKSMLMEHFDQTVTDARLRKQELEAWLQEHRDPRQVFHPDFIIPHSSGSSGSTAIFVYDRAGWAVLSATMATYFPRPECEPPQKTRVVHYKAAHGHFAGAIHAVRMPRAVYDVLLLSILAPTAQVIEQLNTFQPHRLVGYSAGIAMLAEWALHGALRIRPRTIIVGGELLTASMERRIQEAWGASLYLNYGATESITLAVRGPHQHDMMVLDDLNILEVLDAQDQPVAPGSRGRVVLTNLYNRALPLLRYELGDDVVRGVDRHTPAFSTVRDIQGRAGYELPIILNDGTPDIMYPEFYVNGLQVMQCISSRPDHVQLEYVAHHDLDQAIREEFQRLLAMKGAGRTTFEVRRVPHIAADPRTGKFHLVRMAGSHRPVLPPVVTSPATPALPQDSVSGPAHPFIAFAKADVEQAIPARFEQQVQRYPERLALKTQKQTLTYADLNTAANRVAHAILARQGTDAEPVALLFEHDASIITAILGVLKAGKMYVALDPTLPQSRLRYLLEDAQASMLLTHTQHVALAQALCPHACQWLNIDTLEADVAGENPQLSITPERFACIVYTSGSTGQPKGVIQNHKNILHKIMHYTNDIYLCAEDRLVLLASCSVGASMWNMFGALLNGASLFPIDLKDETGLVHLAAHLLQERITIYHSTPSVFRHCVGSLIEAAQFPDLRLIRLAGEPVYKHDVELYKRYFSQDCLLYVALATTETGCISQYTISKETLLPGSTIPAGHTVEDVEVLLRDDEERMVAPDQIGEIVVKSRYLSPGYWRRADLTAAAFLPDPDDPEGRLYRTGDLGLRRPNGCLEHLGRKDWQVKIRGYRVEIPEIEMALVALDSIKAAAVVAHADESGNQRLVAYLVPSGLRPVTVSTIRRALAETLPNYMLPAVFVLLEALPLTANGKVDRQALPAPSQAHPPLASPYVAPRTAIERTLAAIWAEVLHLERVGVHDNFFDVGGHSLSATQVMAHVRDTLGTDIPWRAFFEMPTVGGLALIVVQQQAGQIKSADLEEVLAELERL